MKENVTKILELSHTHTKNDGNHHHHVTISPTHTLGLAITDLAIEFSKHNKTKVKEREREIEKKLLEASIDRKSERKIVIQPPETSNLMPSNLSLMVEFKNFLNHNN